MLKLETYWCEDVPTLEDIKEAYDKVKADNVIVRIEWFVKYNGKHSRMITKEVVDDMPDYERYFKEVIPHCYGV